MSPTPTVSPLALHALGFYGILMSGRTLMWKSYTLPRTRVTEGLSIRIRSPQLTQRSHSVFPLVFGLILGLISVTLAESHPAMVTANVVHRTFQIKWQHSQGTVFEIGHNGEHYLITARHVVKGIQTGDTIEIRHEKAWMPLPIEVVGKGDDRIDVAVLKSSIRLSDPLELPASSKDIMLSQQVFFLGFPFGWEGGHENINRGFPLALVKSGILSSMPTKEGFYIDAHGNKGFSGGPVLFVPRGQPRNKLSIAGIVVRHPMPPRLLPIVDQDRNEVVDRDGRSIGIVDNPGFVVAIDISEAIALIDAFLANTGSS